MHFIGFIIRIYYDARSSECQIRVYVDRVPSVGKNVYSAGEKHKFFTQLFNTDLEVSIDKCVNAAQTGISNC